MSLIPWKAAAVLGLIIACEVMLGVKLDHQSSALPCARHSPRHRTAPHRPGPPRPDPARPGPPRPSRPSRPPPRSVPCRPFSGAAPCSATPVWCW